MLHKAVSLNDWQLVETLLNNVTDYSYETAALAKGDSDGNTPAHYVAKQLDNIDRHIVNHVLGQAHDARMSAANDAGQTVTEAIFAHDNQEKAGTLLTDVLKRRAITLTRRSGSTSDSLVPYTCKDITVGGKKTSLVEEAIKHKDGWLEDLFDVFSSDWMSNAAKLPENATLPTLDQRNYYKNDSHCAAVIARVSPGPTLAQEFSDLSMSDGDTYALDMTDYFVGTEDHFYKVRVSHFDEELGLDWSVWLNQTAQDKVTGVWSGKVLTLTAGSADPQRLGDPDYGQKNQ